MRSTAERVLLLVAAVVVVVLAAYLVVQPPGQGGSGSTGRDSAFGASLPATPTDQADPAASASPSAESSDDPEAPTPEVPPRLPRSLQVDFATDALPASFEIIDQGRSTIGLEVGEGLLAHGDPQEAAAGYVETRLDGGAVRLGVRARFPADGIGGQVTLMVSKRSLARSAQAREEPPSTGVRMSAAPGSWRLEVLDPRADQPVELLLQGSYESTAREQSFELFVQDGTVWLVDPSGTVSRISDYRVADLVGPWASWGLVETAADVRPASIARLWAG